MSTSATDTIALHPLPGTPAGAASTSEDLLRDLHTHETAVAASPPGLSKTRRVAVIITIAGITFVNSIGSGILIAALPRIAQEVGLAESLILWPAAVYSLTAGCLPLIFGAMADIIGAKLVWVTGSFLFAGLTVGLGLAKTALQVIIVRALLGVAISLCLPTAVSLITNTFARGTWRNVAFAMNGMGQPLGFAIGLVLGGIFTDTIGWRWAYILTAMVNVCLSLVSVWSLPAVHQPSNKTKAQRLAQDIDWLGMGILSVALVLVLYVLAVVTSSYRSISSPLTISLLIVSVGLLVAFPVWMRHQTNRNKPALIPNHLWRKTSFTFISVAVFFCWAALNGIEYFTTLYFQQVEGVAALQSSIRFLPHVVMGVCVNVGMAFFISRFTVRRLAVVSAIITMVTPPLMATIPVGQNYWFAPFWALFLSPANADGKLFLRLSQTHTNFV
ncbi:hypothetical protein VHEMI01517 [[Torrubiella] hemipterigena]|uniref:Major facilitator superfamily (MFS) profile domain-containing protein n=1 Tax=[Torrubiella] hemipterigena TaxID=1531966 RepID=A0A0A1T5L5_9HYPO|nr:hypothetical protein VHEMI01517 [[Torrubiella] hemipterigena]